VNESNPCRVRVVVEPSFGERLATLPAGEPVWIVESANNPPVARRLWTERPTSSHLAGITTFRPGVPDTPEEHLLSVLDTIDLHHGHYSADPPYSVLEVIGCEPSPRVSAVLDELGFSVVARSADGFTASTRTSNDNPRNA
jgi:hypothetical protein